MKKLIKGIWEWWKDLTEDRTVWLPALLFAIVLMGLSWLLGQGVPLEPLWVLLGVWIGLFANKRSQRRQNTFEVNTRFEEMIDARQTAMWAFKTYLIDGLDFDGLKKKIEKEESKSSTKICNDLSKVLTFYDNLGDLKSGRMIDEGLAHAIFWRAYNQFWRHFEKMQQAGEANGKSDGDFQMTIRVCGLKDWLYNEEYQRKLKQQEEQ